MQPLDKPLIPPANHAFLTKGATLQKGDKVKFGDEWMPLTNLSIGDQVNLYTGYARLIKR